MKKFSRTVALKIESSYQSNQFTGEWMAYMSDNNEITISISELLGHNVPETGKYLIPCNLVCENRTGKCIKLNKGIKAPICQGQFYYIRNHSR